MPPLCGKLIGISIFTWFICKCKLGVLPEGMKFGLVNSVSLLAGISFTMSIFIAEMGFGGGEDLIFVNTGIFTATALAVIGGFLYLYSKINKNDFRRLAIIKNEYVLRDFIMIVLSRMMV